MNCLYVLLVSVVASGVQESSEELSNVFEPSSEWQVIGKDQAIPRGLHVRINLKTGQREAKLWDHPSLAGDRRRTHHHGYSDRRGIINKQSKVFTREEYLEMLRDDSRIHYSHPLALTHVTGHSTHPHVSTTDRSAEHSLPVTLHSEVTTMLDLLQLLAMPETPSEQLQTVLDELEYHVHEIDNGRDLISMGGLPVLLRLLNHSDPQVKSSAALTLGAAAQSNPVVQYETVLLGGLQTLCTLVSLCHPDLVQRRGLFAIGALVRGSPSNQQLLLSHCSEFHELIQSFDGRSDRVKLKAITLITDLSVDNMSVSVKWCDPATQLLLSDSTALVEARLGALRTLNCHQTRLLSMLRDTSGRFAEHIEIVELCRSLISDIQLHNKEL